MAKEKRQPGKKDSQSRFETPYIILKRYAGMCNFKSF